MTRVFSRYTNVGRLLDGCTGMMEVKRRGPRVETSNQLQGSCQETSVGDDAYLLRYSMNNSSGLSDGHKSQASWIDTLSSLRRAQLER